MSVPLYLGRVLGPSEPSGTCFQVAPGVLVTAWHVLERLDAGRPGARVAVSGWTGLPPAETQVVRVDELHDLAVMRSAVPLPASIRGAVATSTVRPGTDVMITGVADVDDPGHTYDYLDAPGKWQGTARRDQRLALGRVVASAVMPGMSGAPVRRLADEVVVGVVCARYNSADGWLAHSVWVAGTEQVSRLLAGISDLSVGHADDPLPPPAVSHLCPSCRTSVVPNMGERCARCRKPAPERSRGTVVVAGDVPATDLLREARSVAQRARARRLPEDYQYVRRGRIRKIILLSGWTLRVEHRTSDSGIMSRSWQEYLVLSNSGDLYLIGGTESSLDSESARRHLEAARVTTSGGTGGYHKALADFSAAKL